MPIKRDRRDVTYKVNTDPNNFTLVECYTTAKGTYKEDNVAFFSTLEKLRNYVITRLLRVEGLDALNDAERKLKDLFNHHTRTPVPKKVEGDEDERYKLPEEYEDCLLGECMLTGNYIYSYEKCIDVLQDHHGMSEDEAVDYFNYNILGTVGEGYPVYLY